MSQTQKHKLVVSISAPKSGTTALFHCLARCADIAVPKIKEPCYFAPKNGPNHSGLPRRLHLNGRHHLGAKWFDGLYNNPAPLRLDFSTFYSATPNTPQLLYRHDPDARLVMVLRDPVKRFVSHYYHYRKMGLRLPPIETVISTDNALRRYLLRFADYELTYFRFSDWFPLDQISLLKFEDMIAAPKHAELEMQSFLGLSDFKFKPKSKERNSAGRPRSVWMQNLLLGHHMGGLSALAPISPKPLLKLRRKIVSLNTAPARNPTLLKKDEDHLRDLLAAQYDFIDHLFPKKELAHAA
ncbi:MAG: sulfotransferase domain-containing protein [Pseudomonadota bacterium]